VTFKESQGCPGDGLPHRVSLVNQRAVPYENSDMC
jgi:hypothetical protein